MPQSSRFHSSRFQSSRQLAVLSVCAALMMSPLPASAQWIASGRWGTEGNWRYVVPGTWMVLRSDNVTRPVSIHAEGANHVGRIALWCDPEARTSEMRFDAYHGEALHQPITGDTAPERVTFEIDGQSFERSFSYNAMQRFWVARDVLDAPFLDAFSWGNQLQLRNAAGDEITRYRLNGSSQAREALRRTCQF